MYIIYIDLYVCVYSECPPPTIFCRPAGRRASINQNKDHRSPHSQSHTHGHDPSTLTQGGFRVITLEPHEVTHVPASSLTGEMEAPGGGRGCTREVPLCASSPPPPPPPPVWLVRISIASFLLRRGLRGGGYTRLNPHPSSL